MSEDQNKNEEIKNNMSSPKTILSEFKKVKSSFSSDSEKELLYTTILVQS